MTDPVLIVGATRGLGLSLAKLYATGKQHDVYGTTRSDSPGPLDGVKWLTGIDLMKPDVGDRLVQQLKGSKPLAAVVSSKLLTLTGLDVRQLTRYPEQIISAGHFTTEDLSAEKGPNWEEEVRMYTTSSIAPVFLVHRLVEGGFLRSGSKIVLVSSEAGSIALRHEKEGGGNYAHHASKAALNMVGKLLSLDLKEKGIVVSIIHPGFMRSDMTKGVGFDKYWDAGGGKLAP